MSNCVRVTFEFHGLPDGSDRDLVENAVDDLQLIIQDLNGYSAEELKRQVDAVMDRARLHHSHAEHVDVRVEVIR